MSDGLVVLRERPLKIVLVMVGLFFAAAVIPTYGGIRGADPNTGDTMQRDSSAPRSFWS